MQVSIFQSQVQGARAIIGFRQHICPILEQELEHFQLTVLGGCVQRSITTRLAGVHIGTMPEKLTCDLKMPAGDSRVQRLDMHGILRGGIHRGSLCQKEPDELSMPEKSC